MPFASVVSGSRRRRADSRGAVAVEFALVLPVFVMLVFGIISFGLVLSQKLSLNSSVRDGARLGSVTLYADLAGDPRDCRDVLDATLGNIGTIGMGPKDVTVVVQTGLTKPSSGSLCSSVKGVMGGSLAKRPCEGTAENANLYVTAAYPSRISIPLAVDTTVNLESTGTYRCEYQ